MLTEVHSQHALAARGGRAVNLVSPKSLTDNTALLKLMMAISGFLMFGFLLAHLSGNLLVFAGREALNQYAGFLHSKPILLWGARVGLLVTAVIHVACSLALSRRKSHARPIEYERRRYRSSSYTSRAMPLTGAWIAGFIVLHLLHFTAGTLQNGFRPGQPFENVVLGFQIPAISVGYIVTMGFIGLHLQHGLWSMFQTAGWNDSRREKVLRRLASVAAFGISAGFSAVPAAILIGLVS